MLTPQPRTALVPDTTVTKTRLGRATKSSPATMPPSSLPALQIVLLTGPVLALVQALVLDLAVPLVVLEPLVLVLAMVLSVDSAPEDSAASEEVLAVSMVVALGDMVASPLAPTKAAIKAPSKLKTS